MAQTDFFLSIEEREQFVLHCFEKKCSIVPHLHYSTSDYITLHSMDEYKKCDNHTMFSIVNSAFSDSMLGIDFNIINNRKRYFIMQRYGGPTIDFFSPIFGQIDNKTIGPGYIGIYPFYYDKKGEKLYPNDGLKQYYNEFIKFIKKISTPVKLTKRTFWIGHKAIDLCRSAEYRLTNIDNNNLIDLL